MRFLKAGIIEAGVNYDTPQGTPQGGVVSPILANIYLHYVLDIWFDRVVRKHCKGEAQGYNCVKAKGPAYSTSDRTSYDVWYKERKPNGVQGVRLLHSTSGAG